MISIAKAATIVAASVIVAAGCTSERAPSAGGRVGSGITEQTSPDTSATDGTRTRSTATTATTAEANPAVDPCSATWADFPAEVRPADTSAKGIVGAPRPGDGFDSACTFSNSLNAGGTPDKPTGPGAFAARIIWSSQVDSAKLAAKATPKTWSGKSGGLIPQDAKHCVAYIAAGDGHLAIQLLNNRFTQVDACGVADAVMTAITARLK